MIFDFHSKFYIGMLVRKSSYTYRYLHATSREHPSQINTIHFNLAIRSKRLCYINHLLNELKLLREALLWNSYSNYQISKALLQNTTINRNKIVESHQLKVPT